MRYNISCTKQSKYGSEMVFEVAMAKNTRVFLVNEDSLIVPLDGKAMSGRLVEALCEQLAWREYDKYWFINQQRELTSKDVAIAKEQLNTVEWDE